MSSCLPISMAIYEFHWRSVIWPLLLKAQLWPCQCQVDNSTESWPAFIYCRLLSLHDLNRYIESDSNLKHIYKWTLKVVVLCEIGKLDGCWPKLRRLQCKILTNHSVPGFVLLHKLSMVTCLYKVLKVISNPVFSFQYTSMLGSLSAGLIWVGGQFCIL